MRLTYSGPERAQADIGLAIGSGLAPGAGLEPARLCGTRLTVRRVYLFRHPGPEIPQGLSNIQNYLRCDRNLQQFSLITAARVFIVTMGATEESKKGRL
jgi:hypothetical protein